MPRYDKIRQVREVVNSMKNNFITAWKLGKFLTVDEMMIQYKGTYCSAYQYMPKKPQKWGIKVWSLADAKSKYVYNFNIYCGLNILGNGDGNNGSEPSRRDKSKLANDVVMKLVHHDEGKRHCIVMDNYFLSTGLFEELRKFGMYTIGTI